MELPEQLRVQNLSNPTASKTFTHKTQPTSFSQSMARFQLPQQGILSASTMLEFSAKAGFNQAIFPCLVGARSLIERAVLSTASGKIIQDSRYFTQKEVCEQPFRSATYAKFKAPYLSQAWYGFINCGLFEDAADTEGCLRLANIEMDNNDGTAMSTQPSCVLPNVADQADNRNTQQAQVQLSEFFPFLYNTLLPLGSMEKLYLDVYWRADSALGDVFVASSGNPWATTATPVNQLDVFLCSDHVVYDDPSVNMEIEARMEENLTFNFTDTATQVVNIVAPTGATHLDEREADLGCIKYKLTDVRNIALEDLTGSANLFFGKYYSSGVYSQRNIQLIINDAQVFPNNNQVMSENYSRLNRIYNIPAQIPKPIYAHTNAGSSGLPAAQTLNGHTQGPFAGKLNIQAIELRDDLGQPMQNGNAPVRLLYKRQNTTQKGTFNSAEVNYFFMNYLRSFSVSKNGIVMVSEYV
jgi:hypothetical protein